MLCVRAPEVICIDFTGCTNQDRFWTCSPQGIDGGLATFAIGCALVDGEREDTVDFIHSAIQLLVQDVLRPDVEYLQATRLLMPDGAFAILQSHQNCANDDSSCSYGGSSSMPLVGSWCVPAAGNAFACMRMVCGVVVTAVACCFSSC